MDLNCDALQKYQCLSHQELSKYIIDEFDHLLKVLNTGRKSVQTDLETVQRTYRLACVLWQSQTRDLMSEQKEDCFDFLLQWTSITPPNSDYGRIKLAVDRVLCSMCSIKPALYDRLLIKLGITPGNQGCENVYTFRHTTPDLENEGPPQSSVSIDLKLVNLTENMLKTLSAVSLSLISTHKLIQSHFLSVLIDVVIDFVIQDTNSISKARAKQTPSATGRAHTLNVHLGYSDLNIYDIWPSFNEAISATDPSTSSYPMLDLQPLVNQSSDTVPQPSDPDLPSSTSDSVSGSYGTSMDTITAILNFFADLCWQNALRKWLTSEKNILLWNHLIGYLCIQLPGSQKAFKNSSKRPSVTSIKRLEEATINFFSKCCCGHFQNQEKLAQLFSSILNEHTEASKGADLPGLSDFTRRILLECITSPGHIFVSVETGLSRGISKIGTAELSLLLPPPAYPTSKKHQLLYLNVDRTCMDILKKVTSAEVNDKKKCAVGAPCDSEETHDEKLWENCQPSTSKECTMEVNPIPNSGKRTMDHDSIPEAKKFCAAQTNLPAYKLMFFAPMMEEYININQHWTIAQILQVFVPSGDELQVPVISFLLSEQELAEIEDNAESYHLSPPAALQKFVAVEGFISLAAYIEKKSTTSVRRSTDAKSIKRRRLCALNQMSAHTLLAFGQFLRLPEYRNDRDTKTVVQSLSGLGKEANFNCEKYSNFFSQDVSKMCNPLQVLPFELLRLALTKSVKTPSNIPDLHKKFIAAIDLVLIYLSIYTHHSDSKDIDAMHVNTVYRRAIQQSYEVKKITKSKRTCRSHWPKGTGYSSSNSNEFKTYAEFLQVEETEELITSLLLVVGNYICPHPNIQSDVFANHKEDICNMLYTHHLSSSAITLIQKSCVQQVIMSYLRNDSIFDIVKHIPLYKAITFVVRALVSNVQLASLVLTTFDAPAEDPGTSKTEPESIAILLTKLGAHIDNYMLRTINGNMNQGAELPDDTDIQEHLLFTDVCHTVDIVRDIQRNCMIKQELESYFTNVVSQKSINTATIDSTVRHEPQENYVEMMKGLQFGEFEMVTEVDGTIHFNLPYHFQKEALHNLVTIPARMKRLAMEMSSLASSLPLSNESAIFVRHDESRIDIIKALITGPAGTPYMNGCFEFDIFCPSKYPNDPVAVNFETTGRASVRFNPNLYNNGKVCLSLLGTWPGENWNPKTSSILQVLVSIQAMILVPEPYFNEPGWETNRGTKTGDIESKSYNDNLLPSTIRHAMINQILSPSPCFKKIIHTHFWLKRDEIKTQVNDWIRQCEGSKKNILEMEATQLFKELDELTLPS